VQPCKACLACASTDTCTGFDDDWAKLASNVVRAQAFVIGGWMPFGILDARTKAFLERTFSLRHSILLNAGKLGVAIITGTLDPNPAADDILDYYVTEGIAPLGKITPAGVDRCWSYGYGDVCVQGSPLPLARGQYGLYKIDADDPPRRIGAWPHMAPLATG
jgi:multimeric flavodoxin WrbA